MRIGVLVIALAAWAAAGPEREARIQMHWGGAMPKPDRTVESGKPRPEPVLVYVPNPVGGQDQERFEKALAIQQFVLCSRFFDCVQISENDARKHPLLKDVKFKTPCLIVFNSTLKKRAIVRARASAMKAYNAMRKLGQPDYKTPIKETLRKAKVVLSDFDQVDEAREVLDLKKTRHKTAVSKREFATAKNLQKEIDRDQAEIDVIYKNAVEKWTKLWTLRIKKAP